MPLTRNGEPLRTEFNKLRKQQQKAWLAGQRQLSDELLTIFYDQNLPPSDKVGKVQIALEAYTTSGQKGE